MGTLDRKVSEVINRSRMNSNSGGGLGAGGNNNADIYGPLSFSYNRRASRTSPGSVARRLSPSRRQSEGSGLVRFGGDDEDDEAVKVGGNLTEDDSSADDHDGDRVIWSDDDEEYPKHESTLNNAFTIKRKSISRKPIRSKGGRQSSMSIHSVTTVSSEEGINPAISVVSVSQAGFSVEPDMQRVKVPGVEAKQPAPSKVPTCNPRFSITDLPPPLKCLRKKAVQLSTPP